MLSLIGEGKHPPTDCFELTHLEAEFHFQTAGSFSYALASSCLPTTSPFVTPLIHYCVSRLIYPWLTTDKRQRSIQHRQCCFPHPCLFRLVEVMEENARKTNQKRRRKKKHCILLIKCINTEFIIIRDELKWNGKNDWCAWVRFLYFEL